MQSSVSWGLELRTPVLMRVSWHVVKNILIRMFGVDYRNKIHMSQNRRLQTGSLNGVYWMTQVISRWVSGLQIVVVTLTCEWKSYLLQVTEKSVWRTGKRLHTEDWGWRRTRQFDPQVGSFVWIVVGRWLLRKFEMRGADEGECRQVWWWRSECSKEDCGRCSAQ